MSTNTVTAIDTLPVLVSATAADQEGVAIFESLLRPFPVQRLKPADFEPDRFRQSLREDQREELIAVVELIRAYKLRAEPAAKRTWKTRWKKAVETYERLLLARKDRDQKIGLTGPEEQKKDLEFGRWLISMQDSLGLDLGTSKPERAAALWSGYALGRHVKSGPRSLISQIISRRLVGVRLVLWWSKESFLPALYCGSEEAGFYIKALLTLDERKGLAVCRLPRCRRVFKQSRPNQEYCSPAHREADRVRRWRMTPKGQRALRRAAIRRKRTRLQRSKRIAQ